MGKLIADLGISDSSAPLRATDSADRASQTLQELRLFGVTARPS